MTSAVLMFGILELAERVDEARAWLGKRPPWWRPFARRTWDRKAVEVNAWVVKAQAWIRDALEAA